MSISRNGNTLTLCYTHDEIYEFDPMYLTASILEMHDDSMLFEVTSEYSDSTPRVYLKNKMTTPIEELCELLPDANIINGDGTSDTWRVVNLLECGVYSMNEVWIYSAWGSLVYHAKNIAKEEDFWDPEQTGSPDGTYYFRFLAKSLYGSVKRNGMIEVVR